MFRSGGYINIALVFSDNDAIIPNLCSYLSSIIAQGSRLMKVRYSLDTDGEHWVEEDIVDDEIDLNIFSNFYPSLTLSGDAFDVRSNDVHLTPVIVNHFHGILIDIRWDDIVPRSGSIDELNVQTDRIIRCLARSYFSTPYSYAVVGHELDVEIAPEDFELKIGRSGVFPLALRGDKSVLHVYRGSFHLDGLTPQTMRQEIIHS